MDGKWTAKTVFSRLEEAVLTLRALRVAGLKPAGYTSSWPDIVFDMNDVQECDYVRVPRLSPTPEAITRMDEALLWLRWLKPEQAKVVWLYAEDVPRKILCARVGMSPSKAGRVREIALSVIASMLNADRQVQQTAESRDDAFRQEYARTGNASAAYRHVFGSEGISQVTLKQRAARLARKIR